MASRILSIASTGKIENGHHETHEYSGDYDEAFQFCNGYEPPLEVRKSQAGVARDLRSLAGNASSAAEGERLDYFARYAEFLVPYSESWSLAFHLHQVLQQAQDLKKQDKTTEARQKVMADGVPLWLKLAPLVREALLGYQRAVSERNELGALASMHNKYERLALFRLRASMKEYLGELPSGLESLFEEVRRADPTRTRGCLSPLDLRFSARERAYASGPWLPEAAKCPELRSSPARSAPRLGTLGRWACLVDAPL